jgi:hypothetical protein
LTSLIEYKTDFTIFIVNDWFLDLQNFASMADEYNLLPGIIEDDLICIFSHLENDLLPWHEAERVPIHTGL